MPKVRHRVCQKQSLCALSPMSFLIFCMLLSAEYGGFRLYFKIPDHGCLPSAVITAQSRALPPSRSSGENLRIFSRKRGHMSCKAAAVRDCTQFTQIIILFYPRTANMSTTLQKYYNVKVCFWHNVQIRE